MARITEQPRNRLTSKQRRTAVRAYYQRLARKARAARRRIAQNHHQLPKPVHAVFAPLAPARTRPTDHRLVVLARAAILTVGGRTLAHLLRVLGALAPGHSRAYHRVLSHRRWSFRRLTRRYVTAVLARFAPQGPVTLAGDDTVTEHPGATVYGKGCHRDPVRSTTSFTAYRWGHKWVVLALLVPVPFCRRRWALPLMVALYRPPEKGTENSPKRAHKTPVELLGQMLRILMRWFPDRTFVCAADGNEAAHALAELAAAPPRQLTFVSTFYDTATRFEPPPPYAGQGRPRVQGDELPKPAQVVSATAKPPVHEVAWYGGERRRVAIVTGSGWWYQSGRPLVAVRWVFVRDRTGTHREEYFFTTDVTMSPQTVIETYTGRWNIATTFQEMRADLGLETTRGRVRNTVLRAEPSLFALDTVVVWLDAELPARSRRMRGVEWLGKSQVTFSDAITAVRRWLWVEGVFSLTGHRAAFEKLSGPMRQIVLQGLAPAT